MSYRWKYFWHLEEKPRGFTLLTPLFCIEISLEWTKVLHKLVYWRGWRLLIWPLSQPGEGATLEFRWHKERVEEMSIRSIVAGKPVIERYYA